MSAKIKEWRRTKGLTIGKKMAITFLAVTVLSLAAVLCLNLRFLETYYRSQKSKVLMNSFEQLNEIAPETYTDIPEDFQLYCATNNITMILLNSELSQIIYCNTLDKNTLQTLMFGMMSGNERNNIDIIDEEEKYQIQVFNDEFINLEYLQIIAWTDDGNCYLARIPLESIRDSVDLSNRFYLFSGLLMLILGSVATLFLTRRMVRPIEELNELSSRMASLDFDARYTSGGRDEIGQLGRNFNIMSERLEETITELKQANILLQKDIEEKIQLDEMRSEFLGNVTHELKTPIALIQGYAEGLKDNISDDPESREFYCDVIIDEASRMNTMVKQILALNQLESGQDEVQLERFDICEVISGVLSSSAIMLEQNGATVKFNPDTSYPVWGDEFKVEQVITNYLTNAIHHLDGERVISIDLIRKDGIVKIVVFNTGQQIPEESLDQIWIKFYKVDKARTRAYGGSGIGLSIVKAICTSLNQECGCENYENGVAFWFTLEDAGAHEIPALPDTAAEQELKSGE